MTDKLRVFRAAVVVASALALSDLATGAQIELATDAPKPLVPEESIEHFQVWPGFHVELVASEPHVRDPVAIAFDAQGRIFVCEIHGYNLEGYLDVVELNKTGVLDKAVRRIPANDGAIEQAGKEQYGTVKLLEDTDGDGRVDRSTVWADRLPACYGVVAARQGVIVLCAPDVVYLADRDDDGKPEVRQTLFSGFGVYDMWSRVNNPRWCVDNWIYAAGAIRSGGTIRGPSLPGEVRVGATSFRFKPDGTAFEPCSGNASGFGLTLTDWGDRFLVTNQQHVLHVAPLPHRYLARNPYYAAPNLVVNVSTYGHPAPVYPTSRPDPWRLARSKEPAWVKFYGEAEATANGYFTAASGQTIYRAKAFPPEYRGNHFSVDNAQNMVHRCLLERDGAGYTVRRASEEKVEFLTSTEQWFRPVNLAVGPDGALYVVDMYRDIIEDYSAIPRYLQQLYVESLVAGADRGRIWRVVADGAAQPEKPDLTKTSTAELVGRLTHGNAWWRQTAQRLLVERGDRAAVGPLGLLAKTGETPQARLHALYALDGLGALEPALVDGALADAHFGVRMHALRLAERWLDASPSLTAKVVAMIDDPDPQVRLQLAFTLGESKGPRAVEALAQLAGRYGDDAWMQAAVLSSVADSADRLLVDVLGRSGESERGRALAHPLASVVGARHNDQEIGSLLERIAEVDTLGAALPASPPVVRGQETRAQQGQETRAQQGQETRAQRKSDEEALASTRVACLEGLIEGLKRGKSQVLGSPEGQQALRQLLVDPSVRLRELALQVAGLVKLNEAPEIKAALATAGDVALDEARPIDERKAAIALLAGAPLDDVEPVVEALLAARQPLDVQQAAVAALSLVDDPRAASLLLANWLAYTPKVQDAVLAALFSRRNRLPTLLDAIEEGVVQPSSLDAVRREQLIHSSEAEIRRRAESLLAGPSSTAGRNEVLARYQGALTLPRDPRRGQQVYLDQCAKCHQLQGQGYAVGADLATASTRSDETIVTDVLDPSNQITVGYQNYTVVTDDGRIFTGVLAAETATSITLRKEEGVEQTILRRQIDEMEASSISMMPEGLDKEVTPQDLADLISYLREALGPAPPPGIVLFDDEQTLVDVLTEGDGTVGLTGESPLSGEASLVVTPPQRWNLRIPGWEYPVVENPAAGEFRYLRFAWRSRGGHGVMIELAGDGKWPPAEKPLWRYYSGRNTTGWQAVEVSPVVPDDWVVVTRDLWKDFGSFTLTGIAPTALGGPALFDRIELLRTLDEPAAGE